VISTRFFKPDRQYYINRGLHPKYKIFYFIAGVKNDTAFVQPLSDLSEVIHFLQPDRDFLLYVDGHGKSFGQSMERGFELTSRFNINLVVFDWPSDYILLRKTVYSADEVSSGFVKVCRSLDVLHEKYYKSSAFSVIFHSMGNRILKTISSTRLLDYMPKDLFENLIINAAAVKQQNHSNWVQKLNIQKRIFITINKNDFTLRGAAILRMAVQLGIGNNNKRARNAFYVNFSDIETLEHNLFLGKSGLEKSYPNIFQFYDLVFHGKEVKFTGNTGFQILGPSDKSFLFSEKYSLRSP
jgi:hypothetical protein